MAAWSWTHLALRLSLSTTSLCRKSSLNSGFLVDKTEQLKDHRVQNYVGILRKHLN
jgi:hypothetical protein